MTDRAACLERWRASSKQGIPILGAGAGTGISAKCAEAAGADLIIIYNSGRYRMAGRGSLAGLMPYGDANAIVVEMAREVLPIVRKTPVLAGVCGTDPFRVMDLFLRDLKQLGFSGVQNFPTVGLIDGLFRENLEETGMGFMFAPNHHPAMKNIAPVRRELGVRTLFNILGPLTNPAGAPNQLMGVFHEDLVGIQVRVMQRLGAKHVLVVYGMDGMDEVSLGAATQVGEPAAE